MKTYSDRVCEVNVVAMYTVTLASSAAQA